MISHPNPVEQNLTPALKFMLKPAIKPGETILWSRPFLAPKGKAAEEIAVITDRQIMHVTERAVKAISWERVSLVRFSRLKNGSGHLLVERKQLEKGNAERDYFVELKDLPEIENVRQLIEPLVARENPQVSREIGLSGEALARQFPAEWLQAVRSELLPGERIVWAGQPQRATVFSLLVADLYRRAAEKNLLFFYSEALFLGVLIPSLMLIATGGGLAFWDYPWLALFLEFQLVIMLAILAWQTWRYFPRLAYVLTDRRAMQLSGKAQNARFENVDTYPNLEPGQFGLRPAYQFLAKGPDRDLVLRVEHRWSARILENLKYYSFKGLAQAEAAAALQLARQVFKDNEPKIQVKPAADFYSESRVEMDPALRESGNGLRQQIEPRLAPGERLLWAGETRVIDQEKFFAPFTYALTDRRALMVDGSGYEIVAYWEQVVRVSMTRRTNGMGNLKLVLQATEGSANRVFAFKNCPEFSKVQRIVEKLYFGDDSDPDSPPEIEAEVTESEAALKEGAIPRRWRYRLDAELLPGEQLRWLGRANRREVRRALTGCSLWTVASLAVILFIGFWPLALAVLGLLVLTLVFAFVVMLNTVYAITDRRVLQVRGLYRFSPGRTIEFYPKIKMEDVQVAQDMPDDPTPAYNKRSDYIDLVIQVEKFPVRRSSTYSGAGRRKIEFMGIHRKEVEEIKGFIRVVAQRGSRLPEVRRKAVVIPGFTPGFENIEPKSGSKRSRKKPKV